MFRRIVVVICAAIQVAAIGRGRLVSAPIQFRKLDTDVKVLQATATGEEGNLFAAPSLAHSLDNPCVRNPCKDLHIESSGIIFKNSEGFRKKCCVSFNLKALLLGNF
jgi:hypothetical protein